MAPVDEALVATRRTLHGIAEQIVAAYGWKQSGTIRLVVTGAGFAGEGGGATGLELRGAEVIRHPGPVGVPVTGTFRQIADRLGVPFGMEDPPYPLASGCAADDVTAVDPAALETLLGALRDGDAALRRFAGDHADEAPEQPVLWPEHFDVGLAVREVNYGVSPGDAHEHTPYAYVGPWTTRSGDFWNAPFGASRRVGELGGADGILAFFEAGRRAAADVL